MNRSRCRFNNNNKKKKIIIKENNNNIIIINNYDNVYGAIVMTKVIARVHTVHLINAD